MFLGVDGGGSKTSFVLIDAVGRVHARHETGGAYHLEIGLPALRTLLTDGIAETVRRAGVGVADLEHAFIGLPAHGEDSRLQPQLDALPQAAGLRAGRYACGNDVVCSWAGALGGEDGISVVAGTGSIAYGEFAGQSARTGGWGELFSDEGSAHWLAREGLQLFTRMADGREPAGPLLDVLRRHFELRDDLDLCAAVLGGDGGARSDVAGLARLIHAAVIQGDAAAARLFERAGAELADLAIAAHRRLQVPAGLPMTISYTGSVFTQAGALVLPSFRAHVARHLPCSTVQPPRLPPAIGAALQAARLVRQPLAATALQRLTADAAG